MCRGRLFLTGDAAHIVPPTGAKGLNLAASDVAVLATAFAAPFNNRDESLINAYSDTALARVWRATHFSWSMTSMLHTSSDSFDAQFQLSQLRYIASFNAAAESLAKNIPACPLRSRRYQPIPLIQRPLPGRSTRIRVAIHSSTVRQTKGIVMSDQVYRIIEIVGTSEEGIDDAIRNGISRAASTIRGLDWFEVGQVGGHIADAEVRHFQVSMKVGFRLENPS